MTSFSIKKHHFFWLGGLYALLAVGLGAFGAHGLKKILSPEMLVIWETSVKYQFYHAVAILLANLFWEKSPTKMKWASVFFTVGVLIFSGSLYTLTLTGVKTWGAITPIGGFCFLFGWIFFILGGKK